MTDVGALIAQEPSDDSVGPDAPTIQQVETWVADLSSDSYLRRKRATRQLIDAGQVAVNPVVAVLGGGDLETTERALTVLQEIAIDEPFLPGQASGDDELYGQAWQQLNALASTGGSRAARAQQAIAEIRDIRRKQAVDRLGGSGISIGLHEFVFNARSELKRIVQVDENFAGPDTVLPLLQWINRISYARIKGAAIRRPVLEGIVQMPDLQTIAIVEGEIDRESLQVLGGLSKLQHLEFRYVPMSGEMVDYLATLPITVSLTLNGTGAPEERVEALQRALPGLKVEFKQGGFLGVKCFDTPQSCVINEVVAETGAEAAGLIRGDTVLKVDDKTITRFADLQDAINARVPGDTIKIVFRRGSLQRETIARLGKLQEP